MQPMTRKQLADWLVETCLMFGCETFTAYKVAGLFLEGLWRNENDAASKSKHDA